MNNDQIMKVENHQIDPMALTMCAAGSGVHLKARTSRSLSHVNHSENNKEAGERSGRSVISSLCHWRKHSESVCSKAGSSTMCPKPKA